jgi:pimeloyl-ACP methyl ester carboxylesterase
MMSAQVKANPRDTVVLVHGLGAHPLVMLPLARWLRESYQEVVNWGYPSLFSPIERHGEKLAALLRELDKKQNEGRIHLVTHSMGGVIGRCALTSYTPGRLGRFVMLSPPNRGSRLASRVAPYLGRVFAPIRQLTDERESLVCSLPPPAVAEVGIIAAQFDLLVHEPSTHLDGERDHIVLPGFHSTYLWRRETADQVRHFLEYGCFQRA